MRYLRIIVALLTAAMSMPPCFAQGTSEYLPNPITAAQVKQYGDLLDLSDQQRQAASAFHLQYAKDFQTLREGEIEAYVKGFASGLITRSDLRQRYDLAAKIGSLDNQFFDQVQTILADEQAGVLPRVRQFRQRDRLMQNRFLWNSWNPAVDVSQIVLDLSCSAEQRQLADQVLIPYEASLTVALATLDQHYLNAFNRTFAESERAGITEAMMKDEANLERILAIMGPIWDAERPARLKDYADITDLNRRCATRLIELLATPLSDQVHDAFLQKAYSDIYFVAWARNAFRTALQRTDVTDDKRQAIQVQFDQLKAEINQLVEQGMDLVDDYRRHNAIFGRDADYEEARRHHEIAVGLLNDKSSELWKRASRAVNDIAPPPEPAAIDLEHAEIFSYKPRLAAMGVPWNEIDATIRLPINKNDLDEYASCLKLNKAQRRELDSIHAQYMDHCSQIRDNELKSLRDASLLLRVKETPENRFGDPTPESVEQFDNARRRAADAAHRVDQQFFDEVERTFANAVPKEKLQRVRLARQRQWYSTGFYGGDFGIYGPGNCNESSMDLSWMAHHLPFLTPSFPNLESILNEYEDAVTPLMEARFKAYIDYDTAIQTVFGERRMLQAKSGDHIVDMNDRHFAMTGEPNSRLLKANEAISQLNRQALERMLALLPTDAENRLQRLYDRLAYPRVFDDAASAERHLDSVLRLDDLTDSQRTQLENLSAEYRPTYANICKRMIDAVEPGLTPNHMPHPTDQDWKDFHTRWQARKKLLFERQELNVRTLHQLRALLNPDQIQRLGGLPEPPALEEHVDF